MVANSPDDAPIFLIEEVTASPIILAPTLPQEALVLQITSPSPSFVIW
jgi:hypothetical protein